MSDHGVDKSCEDGGENQIPVYRDFLYGVFSGGKTSPHSSMKRFSVTWSNGGKKPNKQNWDT